MDLEDLAVEQDGVVCRDQVLACGRDDSFIETRLRRRQWRRVHRGVYVDHTGPLSWHQRTWAALLLCGEHKGYAAACHDTALALHGVRRPSSYDVVHVAVDRQRHVQAPAGVRVHRMTGLAASVHPNRRPARIRLERAVLQVASAARDDAAAIAVISDVCKSRRTTVSHLLSELQVRARLPRRTFLLEVLEDVGTGVHSVLEHRYVTRVERAHGLPVAHRQRRGDNGRGGATWRDADYLGGLLVVELDGRLGHEWAEDRWADFARDVAAAIDGALTLRLGWRQVLEPCRVADGLARLLRRLGWSGRPRPCAAGCPVADGR